MPGTLPLCHSQLLPSSVPYRDVRASHFVLKVNFQYHLRDGENELHEGKVILQALQTTYDKA